MSKYLFIALAAIALAGCHSHHASVSFTPATLKDCGSASAPSVVEVHWDASKAAPKDGVKVWINNDPHPRRTGVFGGDPGTLWTQGGAIGSATSGNWMLPSTTIIVTDAKSDKELARVKVPSAPCH